MWELNDRYIRPMLRSDLQLNPERGRVLGKEEGRMYVPYHRLPII